MKKKLKIFITFLACGIFSFSTLLTSVNPLSAKAATEKADENQWIDSLDEPEDYAYSMLVVGDPQYMSQYDYTFGTNYMDQMFGWIADNVESKKIVHVATLGDLTHNDAEREWGVVKKATTQLDGVVSYSLVRGNHDNRTSYYDENFGEGSAYMNQQTLVSYYDYEWNDPKGERKSVSAMARNTAHEFSGTNADYLLIALDFGAQDDVLEWANGVVEAYPNHTVIVTTHAYLDQYGIIMGETAGESPNGKNYDGVEGQYNGGVGNNEAKRLWGGRQWKYQAKSMVDDPFNGGEDLWDKFISKHANISMVFCGHVQNVDIQHSSRIGDNGNLVQEFVINPQNIDDDGFYDQGGQPVKQGTDSSFTGMVAIHYFSEDGKTVDVQWYSTIKDKFYNPSNQYSFEAQTTERGAPYVKVLTSKGGRATPTYATLEGQPIEIRFTPDKYYKLGSLKLNGVDVTDQVQNNTYLFDETEGYYQFKATFVEETRYAFLEQNDMSKGRLTYSLSELDATFRVGDTFTVKVTPVEGCSLKSITLNGVALTANSDGEYLITISAQDNVLKVEYDGEPIVPELPPDSSNPTEPPDDSQPIEPNEPTLGCNGSVSVGTVAVITALSSLVLLRKREE